MQIADDTQKEWAQLREWGDVRNIAKRSGYSALTIGTAINSGEMTMDVFEAIQTFYNERKAEIAKLKRA